MIKCSFNFRGTKKEQGKTLIFISYQEITYRNNAMHDKNY